MDMNSMNNENGKVSNVLIGLIPSILGKSNTVNIVYSINTKEELYDILTKLKTLFGYDFKLSQVNKVIDTKNNVVSISKRNINAELLHSVDNIFHTYNDNTGFISYDKYRHKINNIITIDTTRIISIENNLSVAISESYNDEITYRYLEYLFAMENDIKVSLQQHLDINHKTEHYRLQIHIPINEEKHISTSKLEYINVLCNKIDLLYKEN
jgi:hypothetical protein